MGFPSPHFPSNDSSQSNEPAMSSLSTLFSYSRSWHETEFIGSEVQTYDTSASFVSSWCPSLSFSLSQHDVHLRQCFLILPVKRAVVAVAMLGKMLEGKESRTSFLSPLFTKSCHVMSNEVEGEGGKEVFDAAGEGSDEEEKVETKSRVRERETRNWMHVAFAWHPHFFSPVPWTTRRDRQAWNDSESSCITLWTLLSPLMFPVEDERKRASHRKKEKRNLQS